MKRKIIQRNKQHLKGLIGISIAGGIIYGTHEQIKEIQRLIFIGEAVSKFEIFYEDAWDEEEYERAADYLYTALVEIKLGLRK